MLIKSELRLDNKDRLIFETLQENSEFTQQEISSFTGLSQPSIGSRVKKMKELGIIDHIYGINIRNISLYVLKVEVKSSNPKDLIRTFEDCPFFLTGFIATNEMNVTLMFICEQLNSLDAIVDNHIRPRTDVHDIDMGLIISTERDMYVPVRVNMNPTNTPSCGTPCHKCEYRFNGLCPGCPLMGHIERNQYLSVTKSPVSSFRAMDI